MRSTTTLLWEHSFPGADPNPDESTKAAMADGAVRPEFVIDAYRAARKPLPGEGAYGYAWRCLATLLDKRGIELSHSRRRELVADAVADGFASFADSAPAAADCEAAARKAVRNAVNRALTTPIGGKDDALSHSEPFKHAFHHGRDGERDPILDQIGYTATDEEQEERRWRDVQSVSDRLERQLASPALAETAKMLASGLSRRDIGTLLGVDQSTVSKRAGQIRVALRPDVYAVVAEAVLIAVCHPH